MISVLAFSVLLKMVLYLLTSTDL